MKEDTLLNRYIGPQPLAGGSAADRQIRICPSIRIKTEGIGVSVKLILQIREGFE